jgi:LPS-assembly lipoprotein
MNNKTLLRLIAVLFWIPAISACGFTPVYGPNSQIEQQFSGITVQEPANRNEYLFVQNLETHIGRASAPDKMLQYTIYVYEQSMLQGYRAHLVGKVDYKVISMSDQTVLYGGSAENFTAYNIPAETLESLKNDAYSRLMQILADLVYRDLIVKNAAYADAS